MSRNRRSLAAVFSFVLILLFTVPAMADATAAPSPWAPLLDQLVALIGSILGVVLTGLAGLAYKKLGLTLTSDKQALYDRAIYTAIGYAEEWAHKEAKVLSGKLPTSNAKLDKAVAYAADLIQQYGLDKKAEYWIKDQLHATLGSARGSQLIGAEAITPVIPPTA